MQVAVNLADPHQVESVKHELAMVARGSMTERKEDEKSRRADYPFRSIADLACSSKHHFSEGEKTHENAKIVHRRAGPACHFADGLLPSGDSWDCPAANG